MADVSYRPFGLAEIAGAIDTPVAGLTRIYARGDGTLCVMSDNAEEHLLSFTSRKLAANTTNDSSVTFISLPDLELSFVAGRTYILEHYLRVSVDSANRGISFKLEPLGAAGNLDCVVNLIENTDGAGSNFAGEINTFSDFVSSSRTPAANEIMLLRAFTLFDCTTSGTITPSFKVAAGAQIATVHSGSVALWRRL